jgi:hypothetical protein
MVEDFDWSSVQVVELETAVSRRSKHRRTHRYTVISHEDAVAGFTVLNCPRALVWFALLYRARLMKTNTIAVPATLLKSWGVSRFVWLRALTHLERAGLVRIERRQGKTAVVTLVRHRPRKVLRKRTSTCADMHGGCT